MVVLVVREVMVGAVVEALVLSAMTAGDTPLLLALETRLPLDTGVRATEETATAAFPLAVELVVDIPVAAEELVIALVAVVSAQTAVLVAFVFWAVGCGIAVEVLATSVLTLLAADNFPPAETKELPESVAVTVAAILEVPIAPDEIGAADTA